MMSLTNPQEAILTIAKKVRQCRVDTGFTQEGLANRSGVSVAVLRKFERTGKISLESMLKLSFVLERLNQMIAVFDKQENNFHSIDEVIKQNKKKRTRGWVK